MMNYIFPIMIIISFICALCTGRMPELSTSVTDGAQKAFTLILKIGAMLCFWGGMTEIMLESGITEKISRMLRPVLLLVFPSLKKEKELLEVMSFNVTANILGLGNAATPAGLETMRRLGKLNGNDNRASDEMVLFVVLNTAALRIVPTTVAMLRGQYGSLRPMEILLPSVFTSVTALFVGMSVARLGNSFFGRQKR